MHIEWSVRGSEDPETDAPVSILMLNHKIQISCPPLSRADASMQLPPDELHGPDDSYRQQFIKQPLLKHQGT
jgi:hypothetical protein